MINQLFALLLLFKPNNITLFLLLDRKSQPDPVRIMAVPVCNDLTQIFKIQIILNARCFLKSYVGKINNFRLSFGGEPLKEE